MYTTHSVATYNIATHAGSQMFFLNWTKVICPMKSTVIFTPRFYAYFGWKMSWLAFIDQLNKWGLKKHTRLP